MYHDLPQGMPLLHCLLASGQNRFTQANKQAAYNKNRDGQDHRIRKYLEAIGLQSPPAKMVFLEADTLQRPPVKKNNAQGSRSSF
jgi:hypothetical protein